MKLEYNPQEDPNYNKFQHRTLSVYGKQQRNYDMVSRPFSAIMGYNQIKYRRNNQLREIEDIKNRLNRNKVSTMSLKYTNFLTFFQVNLPLRRIEKALLNPLEEEILVEDEGGKYNLPSEADGLMTNPLFAKKKKKRGRRRKGKKGKKRRRK